MAAPPPLDALRLRLIAASGPVADAPWELDAFYIQGGVVMDGDRPYYGQAAMAADAESGTVYRVELLGPEQSAYAVLLSVVEEQVKLPKVLCVKNELLREALEPMARRLGARLEVIPLLPAITEAREALNHQFMDGSLEA